MVAARYASMPPPSNWCRRSDRSPIGTIRIRVCSARSVSAAVGRPPDQKKASSFFACSWSAASPTPSIEERTSLSGSRPAASSSRRVTRFTPDFGCPTPTRSPRRSDSCRTCESAGTTSCM